MSRQGVLAECPAECPGRVPWQIVPAECRRVSGNIGVSDKLLQCSSVAITLVTMTKPPLCSMYAIQSNFRQNRRRSPGTLNTPRFIRAVVFPAPSAWSPSSRFTVGCDRNRMARPGGTERQSKTTMHADTPRCA